MIEAAEKIRQALGSLIRVENVVELRYLTSGVRSILDHLGRDRKVLFGSLARELLVDQAFRCRRHAQIKISLSEILSDVNLLTIVVRERAWHIHKTWTQAEKDTLRSALAQPAVSEQLRLLAQEHTEDKIVRSVKELPEEVARPILEAAFPSVAARTVVLVDAWVEPDPLVGLRIELPNCVYIVKFSHRRDPRGEGVSLVIHLVSFDSTEIFATQEDLSGVPISIDLQSHHHELLSAAEFFFKTWADNKGPIDAIRNSDIFEATGRFIEMPHINRRVEIWRVREPYWVYAGIVERSGAVSEDMLLSEAMNRMMSMQATTYDVDGASGAVVAAAPLPAAAAATPFPPVDFSTAPHESIVLQAIPHFEDVELGKSAKAAREPAR